MWKVQAAVIAAVALSIAGVVMFLLNGQWLRESNLHPQVIRGSYQFFLIVVLGGGISWLYGELTRVRERREYERGEFLNLHSEIVKAYNQSKTAKRLLRAKAWREVENEAGEKEDVLLVQPYGELLDLLNAVQLEFESLKRHVEGRTALFSKVDALYKQADEQNRQDEQQATLHSDLDTIEKYLNSIVKEYETALRGSVEPPRYLPLRSLDCVADLMGPGADATEIRIGAKDRFKSAIKVLSRAAGQRER